MKCFWHKDIWFKPWSAVHSVRSPRQSKLFTNSWTCHHETSAGSNISWRSSSPVGYTEVHLHSIFHYYSNEWPSLMSQVSDILLLTHFCYSNFTDKTMSPQCPFSSCCGAFDHITSRYSRQFKDSFSSHCSSILFSCIFALSFDSLSWLQQSEECNRTTASFGLNNNATRSPMPLSSSAEVIQSHVRQLWWCQTDLRDPCSEDNGPLPPAMLGTSRRLMGCSPTRVTFFIS